MFDKIKEFISLAQEYFQKIGETGFIQAILTFLKKILGDGNNSEKDQIFDVVINTLPEA